MSQCVERCLDGRLCPIPLVPPVRRGDGEGPQHGAVLEQRRPDANGVHGTDLGDHGRGDS